MMRYRRLKPSFVDQIPEKLDPGVIYISMRYATAVHLCCCGCAREVVTPFSPAQWRLIFDGENISLHPSIGSWNLPCRSHYVLSRGEVVPAPSWSEEEVAGGQAHDKRARAAHYDAKTNADLEGKSAATSKPAQLKGRLARLRDFLKARFI